MKNKFIISTLVATLILTLSMAIVLAANSEKILSSETVQDKANIYKEITNEKFNITYDTDLLNKLGISTNSKTRNSNVKYYDNELDSRKEAVLEVDGKLIRFNAETGDFISYLAEDKSYEKNDLSENEVKLIADKIFNTMDFENYILIELYEFDEEIWMAQYAKKYEDLYSLGESVKFSFSPKSEEIVTLSEFNIPYANNEVLITEEDAMNIANTYNLKRVEATIKTDLVRPNYYWENNNSLNKKINEYRKAYIVEFNDGQQTKVYVDCTTGEVIGGSMILGGTKYEK